MISLNILSIYFCQIFLNTLSDDPNLSILFTILFTGRREGTLGRIIYRWHFKTFSQNFSSSSTKLLNHLLDRSKGGWNTICTHL